MLETCGSLFDLQELLGPDIPMLVTTSPLSEAKKVVVYDSEGACSLHSVWTQPVCFPVYAGYRNLISRTALVCAWFFSPYCVLDAVVIAKSSFDPNLITHAPATSLLAQVLGKRWSVTVLWS